MIYREIDPVLYTIDGQGCNGVQTVSETEETVGEQVAMVCDAYNFAVIENTFSIRALKTLQNQAASCIVEHDATKRTQHYNMPKAYGIHKTPERQTYLPNDSQDLLQGMAHGLYRASAGSRRMDTPNDSINMTFVTRYLPGGKVSPHYDETSGVFLETTLEGVVRVTVRIGLRGIARVLLGQNMTLVMPGEALEDRGRAIQAKHSVRNVTPKSEHNGYRLGISYIYGRLSPEERHARLQSRR